MRGSTTRLAHRRRSRRSEATCAAADKPSERVGVVLHGSDSGRLVADSQPLKQLSRSAHFPSRFGWARFANGARLLPRRGASLSSLRASVAASGRCAARSRR
ncbi:hypothetical protein HPB50_024887 [Hyalomma asiaticum]|uniref:Uncharacterized protein n=1 Tax=Hyalomma asiaticum TaxID=266040 RepID=A0ACB7SED8_HYAAI|nr:hypothetical protein HPB50_024887 [Hyalomma asiaticum]